MCGILFLKKKGKLSSEDIKNFRFALEKQTWRGPDNTSFYLSKHNDWIIGHNRLSILDLSENGNQPYESFDNVISYNGEIYNYQELVQKYNLKMKTSCDTELVSFLANKSGNEYIKELEGMFAYVSINKKNGEWQAARDIFGIKPLFYYVDNQITVIGSEPSSIASILNSSLDLISFQEWELFRRPCPGHTFFKDVKELLPGNVMKFINDRLTIERYDNELEKIYKKTNRSLYELLNESVKQHQLADCPITTMLSGGVDSTLITYFANNAPDAFSIGSNSFNEFKLARLTVKLLNKKLNEINLEEDLLKIVWQQLTELRGEPLSVPNEASIFTLCKSIPKKTKVVLTGEGADEIFMGYSRIVKDIITKKIKNKNEFFVRYSYKKINKKEIKVSERFINWESKYCGEIFDVQYVRKFFLKFHMLNLLRRMDFASMAASKEARTPFLTRNILSFANNLSEKFLTRKRTKEDLRLILDQIGMFHISNSEKVAFSAKTNKENNFEHYIQFRKNIISKLNL